jgi:hypothetical protein
MFNGVTLQTLYQPKTLCTLEWISTNSPLCLLGASQDHINRRKQTNIAEEYSNVRERTKQVADKNYIMRNITIFNFYEFTHRPNGKVKNDSSYSCTVPVWPHGVDKVNFIF